MKTKETGLLAVDFGSDRTPFRAFEGSGFQLCMSTSTALISVAVAVMLGGYAQAICANIPEPAARSWTQVSGSGKYWTNKDFGGHSGRLCGQHWFDRDPGWTQYEELTHSSFKFFDTQKVIEAACKCIWNESFVYTKAK